MARRPSGSLGSGKKKRGVPLFEPPRPEDPQVFADDAILGLPEGTPRRGFRPLVVLGVTALALVGMAALAALIYIIPAEARLPLGIGLVLAPIVVAKLRPKWTRVGGRKLRGALTGFAQARGLGGTQSGDVLATGRLEGRDITVAGDGLRLRLRGFDAFDWPPVPSRDDYERWKALALLGPDGGARLDAARAALRTDPAVQDAVVRDAQLVVTLTRTATPEDVARVSVAGLSTANALDALEPGGRDPVPLAIARIGDQAVPEAERHSLFGGLATFHAHEDPFRAAAARLVDDPDARLARAAAELLDDADAVARVDARVGALSVASHDDGGLSLADADDRDANAAHGVDPPEATAETEPAAAG